MLVEGLADQKCTKNRFSRRVVSQLTAEWREKQATLIHWLRERVKSGLIKYVYKRQWSEWGCSGLFILVKSEDGCGPAFAPHFHLPFTCTKPSMQCRKSLAVFPSPAGIHLPNSSWAGIIEFFPARESLVMVSDIPAGDGKTAILFLQCVVCSTNYAKN